MKILNFDILDRNLIKYKLCITIGNFDGVHLGHRYLINKMTKYAKLNNCKTMLITFDINTKSFHKDIKNLSCNNFKMQYFNFSSIDYIIIIKPNSSFFCISHIKFADYISNISYDVSLFVGSNFYFGNKKAGDIKYLSDFSKNRDNFNVYVTDLFSKYVANRHISSTYIRSLLKLGDLEYANLLLGREYSICSKCIMGKKLGTRINFPTVNMMNKNMANLADGVYYTKTRYKNTFYTSMTYYKVDSNDNGFIETNIFNFSDNVYGKDIEVIFLKRIRDIIYTKDLKTLRQQLFFDKQFILDLSN